MSGVTVSKTNAWTGGSGSPETFSALETAYVGSTVEALRFSMPHVCDAVGVNGSSEGSDGMEVSCGGGGGEAGMFATPWCPARDRGSAGRLIDAPPKGNGAKIDGTNASGCLDIGRGDPAGAAPHAQGA